MKVGELGEWSVVGLDCELVAPRQDSMLYHSKPMNTIQYIFATASAEWQAYRSPRRFTIDWKVQGRESGHRHVAVSLEQNGLVELVWQVGRCHDLLHAITTIHKETDAIRDDSVSHSRTLHVAHERTLGKYMYQSAFNVGETQRK